MYNIIINRIHHNFVTRIHCIDFISAVSPPGRKYKMSQTVSHRKFASFPIKAKE